MEHRTTPKPGDITAVVALIGADVTTAVEGNTRYYFVILIMKNGALCLLKYLFLYNLSTAVPTGTHRHSKHLSLHHTISISRRSAYDKPNVHTAPETAGIGLI